MPSDATQKPHMLYARLAALDKQSDESSDTGNFRLPVRSIAGAVLVSGDDSSPKPAGAAIVESCSSSEAADQLL
jgi:hypothetical protein